MAGRSRHTLPGHVTAGSHRDTEDNMAASLFVEGAWLLNANKSRLETRAWSLGEHAAA